MTASKANRPLEYARPDVERKDLGGVLVWLFCGYLLLMPLGDFVLHWGSTAAAGNELTRDRARFAVVNAMTLTGFQPGIGLSTYQPAGHVTIFILMLIGILFTTIVGGLAVVRIIRAPYTDLQVVASGCIVCAVILMVGAIPLIAAKRDPFDSLFLAASSFGNCGLTIMKEPGLMSWQTHLVLLPLAVLGGLGLPVIMELWDTARGKGGLSVHSRTVLGMTAWLYLVPLALLVVVQLIEMAGKQEQTPLSWYIASSSVAALNSRTLGLPFQYATEFPRVMPWLLVLLMMVGGSPAGTAGGIKSTTLVELWNGVRSVLRGQPPRRPFGIAATWLAVYLAMTIVFSLLLLWCQPQLPADRVIFETVSALSNVGMSYDLVMTVSPGLDVLTAAMFAGRLAPLAILWWMAQTTEVSELAIG